MKLARFVNCLDKNNTLMYLGTQDYHTLLSKQSMQEVWNLTASGDHQFNEDLAVTNTVVTPDFDGTRVIYANDTVIAKFEPLELYTFLTTEEKAILLQRAIQTYNLIAKMQAYQGNNGVEHRNPLPPVTL